MPIYEYQCTACGELIEALQKMSDAPLTDCPACGKPALKKKVSAAAFRLKGGGWYETDFKSGGKKNLAGDAGGDSAGSGKDGAAGGKSESAGKAADSGGDAKTGAAASKSAKDS
jgi:putative FmdB family regulatory protein